MTSARTIALNMVATYGRSLLSLFVGLFTSRWVLMALGAQDLGLYGLVAGLVTFISFFNNLISGAISRFYAYSVGESHRAGHEAEGLENCRKWFNTALAIHTILPLVLMVIGYPIGEWAVRHWLVIPVDRIEDCVWIFRFVCVTTLVGMMNVPLSGMYYAKQKIAELTIYSVLGTILNFCFVYYMVTHPGRLWLKPYALFSCCWGVVPSVIIAVRAWVGFPECQFNRAYLFSWERIKKIVGFSIWTLLGGLAHMFTAQGMAIIVNKGCGPVYNASMGIANTVKGHCHTLTGAMNTAFSPAIVNLEGEGERQKMLKLCYRASKIGLAMCMMFAVPLMAEIDAVLELWLKNPPPLVAEACRWTLILLLVEQMPFGFGIALRAINRIKEVSVLSFVTQMIALALAWYLVVSMRFGFLAIFMAVFCMRIVSITVGCYIGKRYTGYSYRVWLQDMVMKPFVILGGCEGLGWIVKQWLSDFYFVRMLTVFSIVELAFLCLAWRVLFDREERDFLIERGSALLLKIKRRCTGVKTAT